MLTRLEREQDVVGLYNQGKTIRDIAKELRMSFRDIGAVLKKEEKEKERQRRQLENKTTTTDSDNNQGIYLHQLSLRTISQAKTPIEVAIKLDLNEKQVTKYYREYWKLKGLHKLTLDYEEIKDDITYFPRLYGVSKAAGSTEHVVGLLNIANNDLPELENRYKKLQRNVNI